MIFSSVTTHRVFSSLGCIALVACQASSGDDSESNADEVDTSTGDTSDSSTLSGTSETLADTGSTDSSTDSNTDSGTDSSTDSSTDSGTDSSTDSSTDTGQPIEPIECPDLAESVSIVLDGYVYDVDNQLDISVSSTSCDFPSTMSLAITDWFGEELYMASWDCDSPALEVDVFVGIGLPNNNWALFPVLELGTCYDVRVYTEPTGPDTCKIARLDLIDPQQPEAPIYSVGSTVEHLDHDGFAVEPIEPKLCTADCMTGEVRDLRFEVAGESLVLAANGFPWATLVTPMIDYDVIYFDAFALTPSLEDGCEGGPGLEVNAWAAKRSVP